jgi:hypothetical protein
MRFILITLLIALICGALQFLLPMPWWVCAATSFVLALFIRQESSSAFWTGFWAIFLLWGAYAFWIDYYTNSLLTAKIIQLFKIPSTFLMVLLTALVGGLAGGFSSLSGSYLRRIFIN